jgi:hypothetical protein
MMTSGGFAVTKAPDLRSDFNPFDFNGLDLRQLARRTKDSAHGRRLLVLCSTRPIAPRDQRTKSVYIFSAICRQRAEAISLSLPWCNTAAMNAHLAEISAAVEAGAHAVLLLDQAGWHTTAQLDLPGNMTILPLPATVRKLNLAENICQFMRGN